MEYQTKCKRDFERKTHKQETKLVYLNNIPSIVLQQSINGIISFDGNEREGEREKPFGNIL